MFGARLETDEVKELSGSWITLQVAYNGNYCCPVDI